MNAISQSITLLALATGLVAGAESGSFDKSLPVSGAVDLEVQTDSGGITVTAGSSQTVKIHATLKANQGLFGSGDVEARIRELVRRPPIEQTGNHVRVGYVSDHERLKNISMHVEIETPANTQVRLRADSGGIHIEGIHGPVDCKTDSGGIDVSDVSGAVRAEADSGGIHARNINGPLFAHVDSGGIEAIGIANSIDASSDSGRLRLEQTKPAAINAKAESGGVTVTLAPGAGYDVSAATDSGHISIPSMTVQSAFSSHHIEGKIGSGGPLVKIRADSGSITIK